MTEKIKRRSLRCGGRPKADFGSLFTSVISPAFNAAGSIAGSLFGNSAQKREMRRQQSIRDWQDTTQEAANMTSVLNNSRDYQEDYLRQFRTAARLGKTLGAKGIYITDGGDATKIGNNTYLLRGGSHEDVNETGQTGIGINVGGNEIEAEGGEVAQKKNDALRIFSAQPILGGISPAQAIMSGANKDRVFNAQQQFKRIHHLSDDGSKAKHGTTVPYKRIHINEDDTFTDTLNNKNYTTSATNGEDVVITGKANHWKEAGKKNTSSYFDPMGAVNFITDAVDALRLAGLHGRSDVRSKVYSKYPSLRKKSLLGSSNRPVKSMRPKALGSMYIPFNKRYTSIYDAPDYNSDYNGGNVLGNGEVTVTAKRIKPTFMKPNNDAMNLIKVPKEEVPYIPQRHNRSRTIFSSGDYLGLGIDTLAALSTGLINYNTAGKYTLPDRAPIIQASKLPTTYNVNPEIEEVKRYRDRLTGQTFNNTSSSVAALNRSSAINLDALSNLSKLWATKENEENKMLTEDAKNQQTIAAQNAQNELARQSEIARIKNEAIQAKGDALNVGLSGLSQAWTNFWTAGRTAYEDDQARRAMIASSKEATPTRLSEMDFDLSPDIIASLYRTAKDDRTKRFYLSRLSPKQRQKYGIN